MRTQRLFGPCRDRRCRPTDRPLHAGLARLTAGVPPAALGVAWADWAQQPAFSPDKQLGLAGEATNPPGRPNRRHQTATHPETESYDDPNPM
ncbi:MAG: poly-beta-hydroxybutyrate polymerase N-terminal domain-containing protein [Hyphomonadaceae bacterium]|nr:poly-beta-hydroxybutyrate polymerase N-terminal domain-containing protein [Hyphomonadaceae bacterium]